MGHQDQLISRTGQQEPVVVNVSLGQGDTLGVKPKNNGVWKVFGSVVVAGALVFVGGRNSAEGSRLNEISNTMNEVAESFYGQFTDPPVEENPACVIVEPIQIEDLVIDSAIMPRPCGELLPFSDEEVLFPDGSLHLGIFIENQIDDVAYSELYDENSSTARDLFGRLLNLNNASGMIEELDIAGLCSQAVSRILEGIEDTGYDSDPLGLGREREVSVKLFEKNDDEVWQELSLECE